MRLKRGWKLPLVSVRFISPTMRSAGDNTPDVVLKRYWLNQLHESERPDIVYDDRQRVVDMWREEGIACFQVAANWEAPRLIEPVQQPLMALLVGPSGAGKSTYAKKHFNDSWVISSDALRQEYCGDFRDQSRNDDVFNALHRLAKARLECGLPVVIDATNLRRRDRLAFVSLVPAGTRVEYVVVDRPLLDKLSTAGWRSGVVVKGKELIVAHHDRFQSSLKDILAGDGLPNVSVYDRAQVQCRDEGGGMTYTPARIEHLDDVLGAVAGRSDFIVARKDGYTVVDYVYAAPDSFDNSIRMECRGIKFGPDGRIIARPFQKFRNVGEHPSCTAENLDLTKSHIVMEKLDGSMIHPAIVNDEVVFMTRMGRTDIARKAERHLTERVSEICSKLLTSGITPIFEFTAPDNRIVIQYADSGLTLLALRDTVTGYYKTHAAVKIEADLMGINPVPIHEMSDDPKLFLHHAHAVKGMEGFVIRFTDGFMVKAKGEDYVLKHRAKDSVLQEKNVLALIVRDELDDVLPLLETQDRANVERYRADVLDGITEAEDILSRIVSSTSHVDQKTFATVALAGIIPQVRSLAFQVRAGANPREAIVASIVKSSTSVSGVDHVRPLFNATFHAANDNNQEKAAA